ncbi:hypothetical protein FB45DRAFT_115231 [Roridomyces roridus]|uniref:F-box domain-containing protein n=1 Tax=Roridomyces roridus TaxID=1738132 RepID=A0AAD7BL47_9AGAR|nr:hypothetical protein FB45DRAFT_115231 [Roridomyces roridus]
MLCKSRLSFFQRSLKTRETDMAAELPGDVLSEIFTHYLPDFPLCPPAAGLGSPALLSHVCSKWREFALDFAAFWRAIPVSVTTYSLPQAANILETWLHRSRSSALSIQLFLYGFIDSTSSFKKFFEMVTANSHRIEHLDLWLYHHHFTLFSGPFPVLKSLRYTPPIRDPLYTSAENQGYSSVKIFKGAVTPLFNEAPKLTEFEITSMWVPPIVFPWKQITRFVCREGISAKVLYGVLKNLAGSVVYCDVRFILGEMDQHKPPIRLAKL